MNPCRFGFVLFACLMVSKVTSDIIRHVDAPLCLGVSCNNGGTLDNATCVCGCIEDFTGLFCETELLKSQWPDGDYGLPMSVYGCPEPQSYGWQSGYINMTIPDSSFPSQQWTGEYWLGEYMYPYLIGPQAERSLQLNFCVKRSAINLNVKWPGGSYCIYQVGDECPDEFQTGSITMTGYQFSPEDISGYLPKYTVNKNGDGVVHGLELFYCCRNDSTSENEYFNFSNNWPFHVFKHEEECVPHPLMTVSEEHLYYTVGNQNWSYSTVHPEVNTTYNGTRKDNVRMTYCYYSPPGNATWDWKLEEDNTTEQRAVKKQKPVFSVDSKQDEYREELVFDGDVETAFGSGVHDWWIQIDLQTFHEVLFINILDPMVITRRTVLFHVLRSHLVVSKLQWLFINNGAQTCTTSEGCFHQYINKDHKFTCKCRKAVVGRYVTVQLHHTSMRYFISEIDVIVRGNKCGKKIGVVSRNTEEASSPSSNQGDNTNEGVCIKSSDENPYIQVDLIVPMVIQGLTLQTWYKESNANYNSSIQIHYGVNDSNLLEYSDPSGNQIFSLHNKYDLTSQKQILFAREILATFIRIYIFDKRALPCVKVEVIGCLKHVHRDIRCHSVEHDIGWETIQGVSFKPRYVNFKESDYTGLDDCMKQCTNTTDCLSVTVENDKCYLYSAQRFSFYQLIEKKPASNYAEKICIKDVMDAQSCGYEIRGPGVLLSPAYPLAYGDDIFCSWHVVFPANKTIKLDVLEIDSLPGESYKSLKCEDELTIYSHSRREHITLQKEKHRGSTLYSSTNELEIEFTSCHHTSFIAMTNISRFAIKISESDLYGCGFLTELTMHQCNSQWGIVASPFYPSPYFLKSEVRWKLVGQAGQYVQLVFSNMDIESDETCQFSHVAPYDIDLHGKRILIGRYCTNHPCYDVIRSSWNILELDMTSVPEYTGFGFSAIYEMKTAQRNTIEIHDNITSTDCGSGWWPWKASCYKFFKENTSISMSFAERKCQSFGGHLLGIEGKEEMTYIQHLLIDLWNVKSTVIIGLEKKNANQGLYDFKWTDGTISTYYDWYKDSLGSQPDGHNSERCTYVEPSSLWSTKSWHDYMCAYNGYDSFICEIQVSNFTGQGLEQSRPYMESSNLTSDGWIFMCANGEVISQVYRCDGVADCHDSSDEKDCGSDFDAQHFKCKNGQSIHLSLYCDHKSDCQDGSDELGCEFKPCLSEEWNCKNKQCIPWDKQCDFHADCWDNSDEEDCAVCVKDGFQCYDQRCIPSSRECDGFVDCSGEFHEDERESCVNNVQESCEAWYRIGKRLNGVYLVTYGANASFPVECQFPKDSAADKVKVIVHHQLEGRRKFVYFSDNHQEYFPKYSASVTQIRKLMNRTRCRQNVKIECTGFGGVYYSFVGQRWFCYTEYNCKTVDNEPALCSPLDINRRLSYPEYEWFSYHVAVPEKNLPIVKVSDRSVGGINNPLTIDPVICEEEIQNISSSVFLCRNGWFTDITNMCVLKLDDQGEVHGCRDMSHLENCESFVCPEMNVKCPHSFCISQNMYCDGIKQCPDGADEMACDSVICSGLFHCRNSSLCIPLPEVCDGTTQCQHGDDEILCNITCPEECECEGFLVTCLGTYNITQLSDNVRSLSIRNKIEERYQFNFTKFSRLGHLIMQGVSLKVLMPYSFELLNNLFYMDLSNNLIAVIDVGAFVGLDNLLFLNISGNVISRVAEGSFSKLNKLLTLDIRKNAIKTFYESLFSGLSSLQYLYTDEYRFCCIKPDSVMKENCYPAEDEFSSCEDLMKNEILRICLWTIGTIALIGNGLSIIFRLIFDRVALERPHGIFVLNLCAADFLMGVYIIIIAIADEYYRGRYVWNEYDWRHSIGCRAAGFFVTLSSEASTTMLSIITLDRLLAIKFPFSRFRFSAYGAKISVLIIWLVNFLIAVIPLLGIPYFENEFYSRSGVCLALPLTRDRPPGWQYSVLVFLVYNFLAFTVVAVGQVVIYMEINSTSVVNLRKSGGQEQQNIARNLFLLVFTDFICWFPVGIMGISALNGYAIPGEVYAWTAVFILPINSALNPILYTATAYLRKRERDRHQSQITELTSHTEKLQYKIAALERKHRVTKDETVQNGVCNYGDHIKVYAKSEIEALMKLVECNLIYFANDSSDGISLNAKMQEIAQDTDLSSLVKSSITDAVKCLHSHGFAHGNLSSSGVFLEYCGKKLPSFKLCITSLLPGNKKLYENDMKDLEGICSMLDMANPDKFVEFTTEM